jgi:hypothetical protein
VASLVVSAVWRLQERSFCRCLLQSGWDWTSGPNKFCLPFRGSV